MTPGLHMHSRGRSMENFFQWKRARVLQRLRTPDLYHSRQRNCYILTYSICSSGSTHLSMPPTSHSPSVPPSASWHHDLPLLCTAHAHTCTLTHTNAQTTLGEFRTGWNSRGRIPTICFSLKVRTWKARPMNQGTMPGGWRINPTDAVSPWGSGKLCNKHVQGQHHDNLTFFLFPPYIKGHQCGFSSFNPHQLSGFSCTSSWVPTQQGSPSFIPTVFPML